MIEFSLLVDSFGNSIPVMGVVREVLRSLPVHQSKRGIKRSLRTTINLSSNRWGMRSSISFLVGSDFVSFCVCHPPRRPSFHSRIGHGIAWCPNFFWINVHDGIAMSSKQCSLKGLGKIIPWHPFCPTICYSNFCII